MHRDAPIHLFVAWAVGAALAFLAESYRRYSSSVKEKHHEAVQGRIPRDPVACAHSVVRDDGGVWLWPGLWAQHWPFLARPM